MTASNKIKVLKKSKYLYADGARAVSLRGDAVDNNADSILNHNRNNKWESYLSNDTTTETLIIDGTGSININRVILNGHNWKDITIWIFDYSPLGLEQNTDAILKEDGGFIQTESADDLPSQDFDRFILIQSGAFLKLDQDGGRFVAEQVGDFDDATLDASDTLQLKLTDSNIDVSTSYFSFSSVSSVRIVAKVTEAQTTNAEKFLKSFVATDEIGTFAGFPDIKPMFTRNAQTQRMQGNKSRVIRGPVAFSAVLSFAAYPGQADADLLDTLLNYDDDFLIWLCGGLSGSSYFTYTIKGFDLDDIYLCQVNSGLAMAYVNNIYLNGYNAQLSVVETVG